MNLSILMSLASPWSREAAIRLAESGHRVHVVHMTVQERDTYMSSDDLFQAADIGEFNRSISGIDVMTPRLASKFRYLESVWELSRILKKQNCELLLALYGGGFAMMAYLCGFRPYAVYVVGSDVLFGGWGKRLLSRFALNAASKVLVNGQYLTKKTTELAPKAKAQCLYLGTDTTKFIPGSLPTRPVKIVCTRGFSEVYNNEYVIHALREMSSPAENFHVIFAAPGPLLERVRATADQVLPSRLRQSVEFLGGVGRDRMTELLRDAHIFVSVSRSDGTSLSLMEGLACGLFPVVSDIPANREWISMEAGNGILVPLDEPKTLAAALDQAIREPDLRAKAATHNRELIVRLADDRRNMAILGSELQKLAHCTVER